VNISEVNLANEQFYARRKNTPVNQHKKDDPFGPAGAARYDLDAQKMAWRYKYAHKIQNDIALYTLEHADAQFPVVVDLGCGTGTDGQLILSAAHTAKYIGIDYSDSMLSQARLKLENFCFNDRAILINKDILQLTANELIKNITIIGIHGVSCVISSFVLHHYTTSQKKNVFKLALSLIPPNGFFIFTDLFANEIKYCNYIALNRELADIRRIQQQSINEGLSTFSETTINEYHYLAENRPQVIAKDIALLYETGFQYVDILYRSCQVAVIVAQR